MFICWLCLIINKVNLILKFHDDVIKWKHFPRYWPFVRGIHRSLVNSPHKGQRRGALMFSLICVWTNGWVDLNHDEAGDLRRHRGHYDVIVMFVACFAMIPWVHHICSNFPLQWRHLSVMAHQISNYLFNRNGMQRKHQSSALYPIHWNQKIVNLTTLSSLAVPYVCTVPPVTAKLSHWRPFVFSDSFIWM